MQFQEDNHYVAQSYLKQFCNTSGKVFVYRTLVSNERVPTWKLARPKGVAKHSHLYTRIKSGNETDDIEKWMCSEFESPAKEAITRAISDGVMRSQDWNSLARFFALHAVRTPKYLTQRYKQWQKILPDLIDNSMANIKKKLEEGTTELETQSKATATDGLPTRIQTMPGNSDGIVQVQAEILSGRALWLWEIRHVLNKTAKILLSHKWTILKPAKEVYWITSDAPAVQLNYRSASEYDFEGGWGNKGTELLMPLGPSHLLYTQIGNRQAPRRGTILDIHRTHEFRRILAEHSYRMIFSHRKDDDICILKPRIVDQSHYDFEQDQWRNWNNEQGQAEKEMGL